MERPRIWWALRAALVSVGLLAFPTAGSAEWSVEKPGLATLSEFGGRAILLIQCAGQGAEPALYLRQALSGTHVPLSYRFDEDDAQTRNALLSKSGHVLQIWNEDEKERFARAKRLRIQLRPFVVFDFDLRGIETVAGKLQCR